MTVDEVLNSITLKKRFCKDCNLPIAVFDNPYFTQRLLALDGITCDAVSKFDSFCHELERFNSEQDYFEYYNGIKDRIIKDIKENPEFIRFSNEQLKDEYFCGKKNLYSEDNNGELFISLDMVKANFSALHYWSPDIFNGCQTWESFMQQYTDSSHIIHSKYIRQVIMGACNPKKQIKYEHHLMNDLAKYIAHRLDKDLEIMSLGEDEILIRVSSNSGKTNNIAGLISDVAELIRGE